MEMTSFDKENHEDTIFDIPIQRIFWTNSEQMEIKHKLQFESFKENFENKDVKKPY